MWRDPYNQIQIAVGAAAAAGRPLPFHPDAIAVGHAGGHLDLERFAHRRALATVGHRAGKMVANGTLVFLQRLFQKHRHLNFHILSAARGPGARPAMGAFAENRLKEVRVITILKAGARLAVAGTSTAAL